MNVSQVTTVEINGHRWRLEGFGVTQLRAFDLALQAERLKGDFNRLNEFMRSHGFTPDAARRAA